MQEFEDEGTQVIIGPFTSGIVTNSIDQVRKEPVLIIAPTISADSLTGVDDNFIRLIASTKEQAELLAKIAYKNNHSKIGIIYDERNKGFTDALVENYKKTINTFYQPNFIELSYNPSDAEDRLEKVKSLISEQVNAVFTIASAEECATLSKMLKNGLEDVQLYGPLWANTTELIKKGGSYVEGMIVIGGFDLESKLNSMNTFVDAYYEEYGENPTFSSVYSYEATKILIEAIRKNKSADYTEVKEYITTKGQYNGITGEISIDLYGDCSREYLLFEIESGQLKRIDDK